MVCFISALVIATNLTICVLEVLFYEHGLVVDLLFDVFIGGSILMGALLMKHIISKIPDLKPNNKYVIIHSCNFSIWVSLYALFIYGFMIKDFTQMTSSELSFYLVVAIL